MDKIAILLILLVVILTIINILYLNKRLKSSLKKETYSIETFNKELTLIKDDETLLNFIKFYLTKVPKDFWTMPASTSGKYHPSYALGNGGLIRHTKAAIKIAESLLALEMYEKLNKNLIITALILHDSVKPGFTEEGKPLHTQSEHPIFAVELLEEVFNEFKKTLEPKEENKLKGQILDIQRMIKSHMGQWNTDKEGNTILPKPEKDDEKFVHLCDYLASRKFLEIDEEILV